MGIRGMSVGDCVKKREQQRMKERESQRVAAMEAKAQREAAKVDSLDDGWAQVASRRNPMASMTNSSNKGGGGAIHPTGSIYMALAGSGWKKTADEGKKERLVLRSGVGAGKQVKSPVVDSWEEEEQREEEKERRSIEQESSLAEVGDTV